MRLSISTHSECFCGPREVQSAATAQRGGPVRRGAPHALLEALAQLRQGPPLFGLDIHPVARFESREAQTFEPCSIKTPDLKRHYHTLI